MKFITSFLLLVLSLSAMGADFVAPNNKLKLGNGAATTKTIQMAMGLGANDPTIVVDGASKALEYSKNNFSFGDKAASDKKFNFLIGSNPALNPGFKWDNSTGKIRFTNDGSSYSDVGSGGAVVGDSSAYLYTGNGNGSTNTFIRNFINVVNSGSDLTGAVSATLGASITAHATGLYSCSWNDYASIGGFYFGFSVNSAQLTTGFNSINAADRHGLSYSAPGGYTGSITSNMYLTAGDVIRPHWDGNAPDGNHTSDAVYCVRLR